MRGARRKAAVARTAAEFDAIKAGSWQSARPRWIGGKTNADKTGQVENGRRRCHPNGQQRGRRRLCALGLDGATQYPPDPQGSIRCLDLRITVTPGDDDDSDDNGNTELGAVGAFRHRDCDQPKAAVCMGIPATPPSPPPHAPNMANKKGILSEMELTDAHYAHFDGEVAVLYNYEVDLLSDAEVNFINRNAIEFVPMFMGTYVQLERESSPTGWSRPSGTNRRCYLWATAIPDGDNNEYTGSSVCTQQDLRDVLDATDAMLTRKVTRIMLYNEPWPQAANPEPAADAVDGYRKLIQPVAIERNLEVISWTSQHDNTAVKSLQYDIDWITACQAHRGPGEAFPCDVDTIANWQIHRYKTKYDRWEKHYAGFTGTWWQRRQLFANRRQDRGRVEDVCRVAQALRLRVFRGVGRRRAQQCRNVSPLRGQNQAKSGDGLLAWLLAADRDIVDTIVPWLRRSGRQVATRSAATRRS